MFIYVLRKTYVCVRKEGKGETSTSTCTLPTKHIYNVHIHTEDEVCDMVLVAGSYLKYKIGWTMRLFEFITGGTHGFSSTIDISRQEYSV